MFSEEENRLTMDPMWWVMTFLLFICCPLLYVFEKSWYQPFLGMKAVQVVDVSGIKSLRVIVFNGFVATKYRILQALTFTVQFICL